MTAVLYDEVVRVSAPATVAPVAPTQARPRGRRAIGGGDPLVDGAARLLCIPLRELYAVLWRVGLIEVTA
jgi:hypothetical protein